MIGECYYNAARNFDGVIDEARVSNIARSADWISTEYNNQNNPGTFYSVGDEEIRPLPGYPLVKNPTPQNNTIYVLISLSELSFTLIDNENDLMDYSVTMVPDVIGGPQTGNDVVNNTTIHIPITGGPLEYNTTYTWQVNVTDGTHWTNVTFSFTTVLEKPVIVNPSPADDATNVPVSLPELSFTLVEYQGDLMDYSVTMVPDVIGGVQSDTDVANGTTIYIPITDVLDYNTTYTWQVNVTDGEYWTNETFSFTTKSGNEFTEWSIDVGSIMHRWFRTVDVNRDGKKEIIVVSDRGHFVKAYYGTNGSLLWTYYDTDISTTDEGIRLECADLNNDGIPEIVFGILSAGLMALHGNNGSVYWKLTGLDGDEIRSNPVIFDLDMDGYPTIFTVTWSETLCAIYSITYDGHINYKNNNIGRCCAGAVSIMDYDNDGRFEIYTGGNTPRTDVRSFWAENLTLRWVSPRKLTFSAGGPTLVDVTGDGIKEVITNIYETGFCVMSAKDGSTLQEFYPGDNEVVFEPAIYDIDRDGNKELITTGIMYLTVYDLVTRVIDFQTLISQSSWNFFQPTVAEVTGDDQMEILCPTGNQIRIFDKNFSLIDTLSLDSGDRCNYASADDVDGDGYSEIIVGVGNRLQVFDTDAPMPAGGVRGGISRYSEYRQGVCEYVTVLGLKAESPSERDYECAFEPSAFCKCNKLSKSENGYTI